MFEVPPELHLDYDDKSGGRLKLKLLTPNLSALTEWYGFQDKELPSSSS